MTKYYSKSTGGFYDEADHGDNMPADVTPESTWGVTFKELMQGMERGKRIIADESGNPFLSDPPLPTDEQLATTARAKRDKLITETDYLLMPDYPITTEKMASVKTYRQLLRDITKQAGFPTNIDWPPIPE